MKPELPDVFRLHWHKMFIICYTNKKSLRCSCGGVCWPLIVGLVARSSAPPIHVSNWRWARIEPKLHQVWICGRKNVRVDKSFCKMKQTPFFNHQHVTPFVFPSPFSPSCLSISRAFTAGWTRDTFLKQMGSQSMSHLVSAGRVKDCRLSQDQTWFRTRAPEQSECCVRVMERDDGYLPFINMLLQTKHRRFHRVTRQWYCSAWKAEAWTLM